MNHAPSSIEVLEPRVAPAAVFVSPTTATYTDADGDFVTVKFTKAILSSGNVTTVLVTNMIDPTHDQLQRIDLTSVAAMAKGTNITLSLAPKPPGDGFANLGYINATGVDLGTVSIRGDLGVIDAGDATTRTPAVKSLTMQSFGTLGTTTGAPMELKSNLVGTLGKLVVKGSMTAALLDISGGKDGKLPSATIGVSLTGGAADRSGAIHTSGDMGTVKIGYDLVGGSGHESGSLLSDGKIKSVTVGHTLFGGFVLSGTAGGTIHSKGDLGKVVVNNDLFGGFGVNAGSIVSDGKIQEVLIRGNLQGGIVLIGSPPGPAGSGSISSGGDIGKITVQGSVNGTFLQHSASISSGGKIGSLTVNGSILGSSEDHSGSVSAAGAIDKLSVGGDVSGSSGASSASIVSGGDIKNVRIGGNLAGGTANLTGLLQGKNLGTLFIGGSLMGANSQGAFSYSDSGEISGTSIKSLTITHNLVGGSAGAQNLARVGYVSATTIQKMALGGDLIGGTLSGGGSITDSGTIRADHLGSLTIGGSLTGGGKSGAGTLVRAGSVQVEHDIASLTIRGSIVGDASFPAVISAVGQITATPSKDVALGKLTVFGDVANARIFAGYDRSLTPVNGGAQIGSVSVTGNWTASDLVASAMNTASTNKNFGDGNDAAIPTGSASQTAQIVSIKIGGVISGTSAMGDHFGFVAHKIGGFFIGGTKITLPASPSSVDVGANSDVTIHQL